MGEKRIGLMFLIIIFFSQSLYSFASSSPLHHQEASPTDLSQEKHLGTKAADRHESSDLNHDIKHIRKYAQGFGHGSESGGHGENGNHGGSSDQGARNFIPVYAAGSHRHNKQHSASNCSPNCVRLSTLMATTLASLLNIYLVFICEN